MSSRFILGLGVAIVILLAGACQEETRRLHAPPQGPSDRQHPMQANLVRMADNAKLSDMCVADGDFIPHTAQLSGTGEWHLNRFAELLLNIGGTIHYETSAHTDDDLIDARVRTVEAFLADAGLDMAKVTVKAGMNRGRESRASEAIETMEKGTAGPKEGSGGASVPMSQ